MKNEQNTTGGFAMLYTIRSGCMQAQISSPVRS